MSLHTCKHCAIDPVSGIHSRECPSRLLALAEVELGHLRVAVNAGATVAAGEVLSALEKVTQALRAFRTIGPHDGRVHEHN